MGPNTTMHETDRDVLIAIKTECCWFENRKTPSSLGKS